MAEHGSFPTWDTLRALEAEVATLRAQRDQVLALCLIAENCDGDPLGSGCYVGTLGRKVLAAARGDAQDRPAKGHGFSNWRSDDDRCDVLVPHPSGVPQPCARPVDHPIHAQRSGSEDGPAEGSET